MRAVVAIALLAAACSTPTEPAETPETTAEAPAADAWDHWGDPITLTDAMSADDLLNDPAVHVDKTVLVEAEVTDVCQKKGCWMVVADNQGRHMRVMMKDHAFGVDKAGAGRTARIEGTVTAKDVDPEEVAHFESEATEGAVIPEKEMGDKVYELVASGVEMKPRG